MDPFIRGLIQAVMLAIASAIGVAGLLCALHPDGWSVIRCAVGIVLMVAAVKILRVSGIFGGRRG